MQPLTSYFSLPAPEFTFAGFAFPRWVASLPKGPTARRIEQRKKPTCGPYYHAPRPARPGQPITGFAYYLGDDTAPGLRWAWCDEIPAEWLDDEPAPGINHRGWFTDDFGDGDALRGIVIKLPKGRGYLAGWSLGEGMASTTKTTIYPDAYTAAMAADSHAEDAAEDERAYQARENCEACGEKLEESQTGLCGECQ